MNWFKRMISPPYAEYAERKWQDEERAERLEANRWMECARRASQANDVEHREYCIKQAAVHDDLSMVAHRRARECRAGVNVYTPGDQW
jgi:hypothetical protein